MRPDHGNTVNFKKGAGITGPFLFYSFAALNQNTVEPSLFTGYKPERFTKGIAIT
jgi:hypothetical protein